MKKIKYLFEFIFILLLFFIFKIIGLNLSRKLSSKLFLIIGPFFRSKKIIKNNILIAFSKYDNDFYSQISRSMWESYGKILAEYTFLKKFRNTNTDKFLEVSGQEILDNIKINAYTKSIGNVSLDDNYILDNHKNIEDSLVRCPEKNTSDKMIAEIKNARKNGDTLGGIVKCVIKNVPVGLGEPVFNKLHSELGRAMLSINAVKGFEYGSGFNGTKMKGSEHNDIIQPDESTLSNYSGGIQGGISNGMDIYFSVAFKPVATIMKDQQSINSDGKESIIKGKGRHDPCVVPRAIPIVEAMAAMVILDYYLINKTKTI